VLYELAWTHLGRGEKQEAADVFARLGKEYPQSELAAESLYRVGEFQYQNEDYAQSAISYYGAFNKAGKSDLAEKAVHKLGWSYFQQKDYERAIQSYRSQIQNHPQGTLAADARAMIGECLYQQEKYKEALPALQEALQHKPSSDDFRILALLHAGQSAAQLKQWEESLKLLEKCATEFPDSTYKNEALYEQGRAKQSLGQTDEAKKLYETVADATDAVVGARARFMLGELQFAAGDHKEAVRSFFKVAYGYGYPQSPAEYHRWQADATFEAARCLEVLKKLDAAKRLFQEFVERFPQNDKVEAARQKLASLGK
jgi:TolA-binding protein